MTRHETVLFAVDRHKLFAGVLLTTLSALIIAGVAMVAYGLGNYHQRLIEDVSTQSKLLGLTTAPALRFNDRKLATDSPRCSLPPSMT